MDTSLEQKQVVIRFAGDSGDGMQVIGKQLTKISAALGNDVQTFPDYPAEIRAPHGTVAGVSGFQLQFAAHLVHTPGDQLDVLVAMNPAALKSNLHDVKSHGLIILNEDSFTKSGLKKAGYERDPRENGDLANYQVIAVPMVTLTSEAVASIDIKHSQANKCKNMYALGLVSWLYERPLESVLAWVENKFTANPDIAQANRLAMKAGYLYGEQCELFKQQVHVGKAHKQPGRYRQVDGNEALALGLLTAANQIGRPLFVAGYPITPASTLLQQMASYHRYGVQTFQAEDEIAAICAAIGAAYGGALAMTCTSGPGFDLKTEGLGLALMTEMPLVVVDVQRAGPSTGMPTKGEQSDLLAAVFGRHGEAQLPVFAPSSPADCFAVILLAVEVAITYMTPVIVLSDANLANGAEPWLLPSVDSLTCQAKSVAGVRDWVVPGEVDAMFRTGGLEKDFHTGVVSSDPENHAVMSAHRAQKMAQIAAGDDCVFWHGADEGELLLLSWGSTYGAVLTAQEQCAAQGDAVSLCHCRRVYPLPADLVSRAKRFKKVLVPEMNLGQLSVLARDAGIHHIQEYHKIQGKPLQIAEIQAAIQEVLS